MGVYIEREINRGTAPRSILRHMLGLYHGRPGARHWRRLLSDPDFVAREGAQALAAAQRAFGKTPLRDAA
jgi:tRNA-dihydrouridine synthase A